MATKKLKTLTTSTRSKKAASKASKTKAKKKAEELKRRKELFALAHKMFGMVYEDYQQGKFHRIL